MHRGPDGSGIWSDHRAGVSFGHRRLAVLDLSDTGQQPMHSSCGRYALTYNGEIYNFQELQRELARSGHVFKGRSDTEVLLAAIQRWGLLPSLRRLNGMFAFALWDKEDQTLTLARDRLGQKPLYYGKFNGSFVFASELCALQTWPGFDQEIDREALSLLMQSGYIRGPKSIYTDIHKLQPGSLIALDAQSMETSSQIYWSIEEIFKRGEQEPFSGTYREAEDQLDELLQDAVQQCMVSDVPLGAFLSGGIDSSLVVALMQARSSVPVKTFTIAFEDPRYNEADFAQQIARHLGTDHTELLVRESDALAVIPKLPGLFNEPFADSSQIPTFLVAELARTQVTVSLSGDGGDELFAGYDRYEWLQSVAHLRTLLGVSTPKMFGELLQKLPSGGRRELAKRIGVWLRDSENDIQTYRTITSIWDPTELVRRVPKAAALQHPWPAEMDPVRNAMLEDLLTYLPEDILTKVDRAAMGVSLETRIPLLDHRLVEFAAHVPTSLNFHDGRGKYLLRQVLARYVPPELFERPKMGFGVPIRSWLRGELRDWAADLLDPQAIRSEGYFYEGTVSQKWTEHLSGKRNWDAQLWPILMFQAWLRSHTEHRVIS